MTASSAVSWALVGLAVLAVLVAIYGTTGLKTGLLGWLALP